MHFQYWMGPAGYQGSATLGSRVRRLRLWWLLLALLLGTRIASADSFGRFGYKPMAEVPGFQVDAKGVKVRADGADTLFYPHESRIFHPSVTNATSQTIDLDCGAHGPSAVRFSLIGNSLDLYFGQGLELDLHCKEAPYLSWKDGTVGPSVPTPNSSWLVLSFGGDEPAIVLGFSGALCSLQITGSAGSYRVTCASFAGWLRLMLPQGAQAVHATDAAALGKLMGPIATESDRWSAPTPKVIKQSVSADDLGVDAEWTFSSPGAIIPPAAVLADLGGYPLSIRTPHHTLPGTSDLGPLEEVDGRTLSIHFPARSIRPGRALGLSPEPSPLRGEGRPIPPAHRPTDLPSIVDLAFSCLIAGRGPATAKLADDTSSAFLSDSNYSVEPYTNQQLPFDGAGAGLDLAAAYALLGQASSTAIASNEPNALFTSVLCKRDWWTWSLWGADPAVCRRATALAALAGALSQDPAVRLQGAMLEAGLEAQRGLAVVRRRQGLIAEEPAFVEPSLDIRASLFALKRRSKTDASFFELLQSPLRIGEGEGLELVRDSAGLELKWTCTDLKPSVITFLAPCDLRVSPITNLLRLNPAKSPSGLSLFYLPDAFGPCQVRLTPPADRPRIPAEVPVPVYSEDAVR